MNVRTMYRIAQSIENILDDIIDDNVTDEKEILEILLDAKRLTDLLSQELNNYIVKVTKG
ncbi:hypothetical protein WIW89_00155 [Stygiolobus sp. CP850M]|uniref:hypothetical protein n=1 Tax=Stygiolobus sp. CP850M TaxID=3133134 RepID=UPI00307DFD0D